MFPSPQFFPEARLNFAGSILSDKEPNAVAILEAQEGSLNATKITWGMLHMRVKKIADAMRTSGVVKGDRVAALIANTEQAITLCLAALSIGAIWSSISPDFGAQGILDRLVQVKPKLIFTNTSVIYNGKLRDLKPVVIDWARIVTQEDSLVNIVSTSCKNGFEAAVTRGLNWDTFLARGIGRELIFEQLPFNQPAFIFYSSGTVKNPNGRNKDYTY
jgi:acetoacetyl-CoA synthetase